MPLEDITALEINGNLEDIRVRQLNLFVYPNVCGPSRTLVLTTDEPLVDFLVSEETRRFILRKNPQARRTQSSSCRTFPSPWISVASFASAPVCSLQGGWSYFHTRKRLRSQFRRPYISTSSPTQRDLSYRPSRRFYVNLQKGKTIYPHPVIPLHLNPRFLYGSNAPYVVMNCWNNGAWSHEERHQGHLSWMPGRDFLLT